MNLVRGLKRLIVADSSCELNPVMERDMPIQFVPFSIQLDEQNFVDDGKLDISELLKAMKENTQAPKTAAPSPSLFLEAYQKADEVFVVTISSELSATYNNAVLAKSISDEQSNRKIHVFDSKSAVCGETLIVLKIKEYIDQKLSFQEIVDKVEQFITGMKTFFVLESLDNLIKNGLISKLAGIIATALTIKPVMTAINGTIQVYKKTRGLKNAYQSLIEAIGEQDINLSERILLIAHCNALQRANDFKKRIQEKYHFKDVQIVSTKGLSTVYTNDGGIVISY